MRGTEEEERETLRRDEDIEEEEEVEFEVEDRFSEDSDLLGLLGTRFPAGKNNSKRKGKKRMCVWFVDRRKQPTLLHLFLSSDIYDGRPIVHCDFIGDRERDDDNLWRLC